MPVRQIATNSLMDGHAVDDITGADELMRVDAGALVDDGTVGVSNHYEFGSRVRSSSKQGSLVIGIVILLFVALAECMCLVRMGRKPPAGKPLLAPKKAEEPAVRPSQQRQSMAEPDDPKAKGKGKGDSKASDDEDESKAAPDTSSKGKGKGDSKASDDEDESKAAPSGPSSKGQGKAPDAGKGDATVKSPPVPPPTPTPEAAAFGRVATEAKVEACNDYRVDIHATEFGQCKCGALKADHQNPRSSLGAAPK